MLFRSWVVKDHQGGTHIHWGALQYLFTLSPVFSPVGWIMGRPTLLRIGNQIYRWIAVNRGRMGELSERFLPYRKVDTKLGLFWTGAQAVQMGLADQFGSLDFVARDVVGAAELVDYTRRENVAERLVKRFGAALGSGAIQSVRWGQVFR